jgi:pimeloyl-ACP methyl ester carboxylesterase
MRCVYEQPRVHLPSINGGEILMLRTAAPPSPRLALTPGGRCVSSMDCFDFDHRPILPDIEHPALVIGGQEDSVILAHIHRKMSV